MTVEQTVENLLSRLPLFDKGVIRDTDRGGNDFCEMIIKNPNLPSFPITVSVTDKGCSISIGQIENVTGSDKMTPDQVLAAINDIITDKIIFVLAYNGDDDIGFGKPYLTRVFAITDGNDDMSEEYSRFIAKISTPIKKPFRPFTSLKGRFLIFSFSGATQKTIIR